jgi:hypothetical protein
MCITVFAQYISFYCYLALMLLAAYKFFPPFGAKMSMNLSNGRPRCAMKSKDSSMPVRITTHSLHHIGGMFPSDRFQCLMKIWTALTKPETRETMTCYSDDLVVLTCCLESSNGVWQKQVLEP